MPIPSVPALYDGSTVRLLEQAPVRGSYRFAGHALQSKASSGDSPWLVPRQPQEQPIQAMDAWLRNWTAHLRHP